jgi:uncharacterized membrane protein
VDHGLGLGVYGLYAAAPLAVGLPAVAGVLIAYARREQADGLQRAHYDFQIRAFWHAATWLGAAVIWGLAAVVAGVGDGDWSGNAATFAMLAGGAAVAATLWPLGSAVFGFVRLASGRPVGGGARL